MIIYVLIINILAFLIYYIDKINSVKNKRRVSEKTLLFLAFVGGSFGAYFSMNIFRHKTKKIKFKLLIPLLIFIHLFLLINYIK